MLAFIPVILLLLAALAIAILQRVRPGLGWAWLVGSAASLAAFGFMLYLRWQLPQQLVLTNWLPFSVFTDSPIFSLDGTSWPYAFTLCAVILSVMFTASARLGYRITPWAWAGALIMAALGILATYSANLLTLALAWTAVDIFDLLVLSAYSPNRSLGVQSVILFSARVTGMVLVILASLVNRSQGIPPTFSNLPTLSALLLLLASGLRLGVLPLNLPAVPDLRVRRGLGAMLRTAACASSLVVLARLPAQVFSANLTWILLAITALGVVYAAAMWLASVDEIAGRPYWLIVMAGMALICVLRGQPTASMAWGAPLLLSGNLIFLYSARRRGTLALPLLGLLGFMGLPFTPTAGGWNGVLADPLVGWQLLALPAHLLLILGYLRFALRPGDELGDMERWVQVVYPTGLVVLILAQWVIGTLGWPGSFTFGLWWAAPLSGLGLILAGGLSTWGRRRGGEVPGRFQFYQQAGRGVGTFFSNLFSLGWLYQLLWRVYQRLEQTIQAFTAVLEGDGGVLWVFVLLALFISLLSIRVRP